MWTLLGYLLFFLMVAFPAAPGLTLLKGCLLVVVLISVVVRLLKGQFAPHPAVAGWTFFFVMLGFLLVLRGLFLATPGAWPMVGVHVLWPIIYFTLLSSITTGKRLIGLERVLTLATIFIPIYTFLYLASETGLLPSLGYVGLSSFREGQGFGLSDGYIQVSTYGLNSMSFLIPFTMATLVTYHTSKEGGRISRVWSWIGLFLALGVVLISGRRALQFVTLLAPLLILGFRSFQPDAEKSLTKTFVVRVVAVGLCGVIALSLVAGFIYDVKLTRLAEELFGSFDFSATTVSNSANERRSQYFALLREWHEHPVLGIGLGMPAYGSIRSETMPWAYELSYLALLCQTGLIGLLAYAAGIVWIYRTGTRVIKEGAMLGRMILPVLVGMTCFLIANATNPYLGKFDGLWAIFLPLAMINYWLVGREAERSYAVRPARGSY
ncbi:MAG: O-antigen ligase family protein [Acidobacteriia bacterium]|nr:O-antigen ligase family protein [Terriglobia bacterium]